MDGRNPTVSARGGSTKPRPPRKAAGEGGERAQGRENNRGRLLGGVLCHLLARCAPSAPDSRVNRVCALTGAVSSSESVPDCARGRV